MITRHFFSLLVLVFLGCASSTRPQKDQKIMSNKDIEGTFGPILKLMDAKPGMTVADVGAGSGAITITMSALMDQSTIYVQDIDTAVLNKKHFDKILTDYSKQSGIDLASKNKFVVTIGDFTHTRLPANTFDLIYCNGTVHVFSNPDSMLVDMGQRLKTEGQLFIRDSFKNDHGEKEKCSDPTCASRLITIDEFLAMMKRNNFVLTRQSPDMSGYPVFGFTYQPK